MNIRVMSRNEAVAHSYKQEIPKCIIVSINCLGDSAPIFYKPTTPDKERVMAVLKLNFNDIDRPYNNLEPKQEHFTGLKTFIDTFKDNPIGSGPYKFVQWDKGQQVIAEANEDYYGNKPSIQKLTMVFLDTDAAYASVKKKLKELRF